MKIENLINILRIISKPEHQLKTNIKVILKNESLTVEQRINKLERYLISYLGPDQNLDPKTSARIERCLRVVLHHRGYYTDALGKVEKELLLLPFQLAPIKIRKNKETWAKLLERGFVEGVYKDVIKRLDTTA